MQRGKDVWRAIAVLLALGTGLDAGSVHGQSPQAVAPSPTRIREIEIVVTAAWSAPSYRLKVVGEGTEAKVFLSMNDAMTDTIQSEALRSSIVAHLDSLPLWEVASPDADDGNCRIDSSTLKKVCEGMSDQRDVIVTVRRVEGSRSRYYNMPRQDGPRPAAVAWKLREYIFELAARAWPGRTGRTQTNVAYVVRI
jgi:hypothetical protein